MCKIEKVTWGSGGGEVTGRINWHKIDSSMMKTEYFRSNFSDDWASRDDKTET